MDETQYTLAGWAMPTDYGTFGLGYVGMGTAGSVPTTRDPGTGRIIQDASGEVGSYSNSVMAFSYSRDLTAPVKMCVGGNVKLHAQDISGAGSDHGTALSLDLGATYRPLPWLNLGADLQNLIGGSIKWSGSEDKLGGYYKLGTAVNVLGGSQESLVYNPQKLLAGLDFDLPNSVLAASNSMLIHAGLEYYPVSTIALRAGLNQENGGTGLAIGIGMVSGGFRFDYAYAQRPGLPGDNPHYFTLSYIGERVQTTDYKLEKKVAHLKFIQPRDRSLTDQSTIEITAEVWADRVLEKKRSWTVTGVSATFDVAEITSPEALTKTFLNGRELLKLGSIEAREQIYHGRNIISLVGFVSPEIVNGKVTMSSSVSTAELKVLGVIPFTDTPVSSWAADPIYLNVTLGLVTGYPDNSFKPDKGISRAELVTLLVRSLGVPQATLDTYGTTEIFSDVPARHWASKFISYGSQLKLVTGYPEGTFKPNNTLNRAEGVTILARYAGLTEEAITAGPFPDLKPEFWANKYIAPAKAAGMLKYLTGKNFDPAAPFSRAEACEVLYNVPIIQKRVNEFWDTGIVSGTLH